MFSTCNRICEVELEDRLGLGYLFPLGFGLRSPEELVTLEFVSLLPGQPTEMVVVADLVLLVQTNGAYGYYLAIVLYSIDDVSESIELSKVPGLYFYNRLFIGVYLDRRCWIFFRLLLGISLPSSDIH